jgi:hypothetical protein
LCLLINGRKEQGNKRWGVFAQLSQTGQNRADATKAPRFQNPCTCCSRKMSAQALDMQAANPTPSPQDTRLQYSERRESCVRWFVGKSATTSIFIVASELVTAGSPSSSSSSIFPSSPDLLCLTTSPEYQISVKYPHLASASTDFHHPPPSSGFTSREPSQFV